MRRRTNARMYLLALATTLVVPLWVLVACSDSAEPSETLVGSYEATFWTITQGDSVADALAAGAIIDLSLAPGGQTSGELYLPASLSSTGDARSFSLGGTWRADSTASQVVFSQQANTFISSGTWVAGTTTLACLCADPASGGVVKAVLTRTDLGAGGD